MVQASGGGVVVGSSVVDPSKKFSEVDAVDDCPEHIRPASTKSTKALLIGSFCGITTVTVLYEAIWRV